MTQQLVVGRHLALALEHADRHRVLIVLGGGEDLALLGRDGGVAVDEPRERATGRLDAKREWRDIEQQHVLDVALQHTGLDRSADRDNLIGVDAFVRFLAEQLLDGLLNLRHARHAAHQNDLVDLGRGQACILEGQPAWLDGLLHEIIHQRLEFCAGELHRHVLRTRRVGGDERQVDLGLRRRGELDLGFFRGLLEPLQRELVAAQINALLLLEFIGEIIDEPHVEVLATEEGVAVGRLHLEHAVADFQNRNVEGSPAQVVNCDGAGFLFVEPICKRSRGRLVDDPHHLEAGDLAGILGGLTLGVIEIGRYGDNSLLDLLAEISLGCLLHLLQDERGDLRGRIGLAFDLDPGIAVRSTHDFVGNELLILFHHRIVVAPADQALDREDRTLRIGDGLPLGGLPDQPFTIIGECHDRGRRAHALRIFDDFRRLAFHYGDARIGGAEVDADDLAHVSLPLVCGRSAGSFRHPNGRFRETRGAPLIRPPKCTSMPPPGGVLAHIGGRVCPARHMITDSRAARSTHSPSREAKAVRRTNHLAGDGARHAYSPMRIRPCVFDKVQRRETMTR